jgi:hypothetical protein
MIKDLLRIRDEIDCLIETYKDLHSDEEMVIDDIGQMYNPTDVMGEEHEKQRALKRIREGYYESTFREKQRKKASESSERSSTLCVYGDS